MKDNHMILCVIAFFLGFFANKLMSGPLLGDSKKCACGKRSGSCTCGK